MSHRPLSHTPCRAVIPVLVCAALFLTPPPSAARPADDARAAGIDHIVAVINEDIITERELVERIAEVTQSLRQRKIQPPSEDELRAQVLEHVIQESLQVQRARRAGIEISEERLAREIESIARRNGLSPEALLAATREQGLTPQRFRIGLRSQLQQRELVEREIASRLTVSEREIDLHLDRATGQQDAEYRLSHILLSLPENTTPEAAALLRKKAENLRTTLTLGGDFAKAAIAQSQGAQALEGGQLGWKKSGQLPDLFLNAVTKLAVGEVSPLLQGANGFHILKLEEQRGGNGADTVTQVQVRHILLRPSEVRSQSEARRRLGMLRSRIEQGEDFAGLARAHSEDPGSASSGGDLGWVGPHEMVPEFEEAMNRLAPGEISAPVSSPFGFHLIQVIARRQQDVSAERRRQAARAQIHARKLDERLEQWLRQLRDEAYVEYHDRNY